MERNGRGRSEKKIVNLQKQITQFLTIFKSHVFFIVHSN